MSPGPLRVGAQVPPLFLDHMAHVIVRHILDGTGDGLRARAGELLFREQRITLQAGNILAVARPGQTGEHPVAISSVKKLTVVDPDDWQAGFGRVEL